MIRSRGIFSLCDVIFSQLFAEELRANDPMILVDAVKEDTGINGLNHIFIFRDEGTS